MDNGEPRENKAWRVLAEGRGDIEIAERNLIPLAKSLTAIRFQRKEGRKVGQEVVGFHSSRGIESKTDVHNNQEK